MGYCLHANGFQFPLHIPADYTTKSPAELWDQVPTEALRAGRPVFASLEANLAPVVACVETNQ